MGQNSPSIGNDRKLRTVVAARFSAIGDVALSVPVVYSVCRCYPEVRIVFVTRSSMTGFFINPPANLTVLGVDLKTRYAGPRGIYRLVGELCRDYRPDVFVDLHDVLRTKLMRLFFRLRGVRSVALDKGRDSKRALTRRHNKVMLPLISSRARYRAAFYAAGLPVQERFEGLYSRGGHAPQEDFARIWPHPKAPGERWVGIAPFAAHKGKIYPEEKMVQVVRRIAERGDCRVFIFGGGGHEAEVADRWAEAYPGVTSLCGKKYGFAAEIALLSNLDVMLSMDSANMHLASIAGTRVVSVWGATHPYCGFKAWRQRDSDTVQAPLSCRPCSVFGDRECMRGDWLCLNALRPDVIYNKLFEQ